jgi:hypothetical protein
MPGSVAPDCSGVTRDLSLRYDLDPLPSVVMLVRAYDLYLPICAVGWRVTASAG